MGQDKSCSSCKKTFPLSSYHRDSRSKDGRRAMCSVCVSAASKAASKKPPVSDPGVTHKTCGRCERLGRESLHPLESFGVARRMRDGRNSWCKSCCSEATIAWQRTETGRRKHIEAVKRYKERKRKGAVSSGS